MINQAFIITANLWQFLLQTQELPHFRATSDGGTGKTTYSAPFRFTISRWISVGGSDVALHCRYIPPSLFLGQLHQDSVDGKMYGQPNIRYHLTAQATICRLDAEEEPKLIVDEKEIPIWISTNPSPPTYLEDFPGEFVESASHQYRLSRFVRKGHHIVLSLTEPPVVTFKDRVSHGTSTGNIKVWVLGHQSHSDHSRLAVLLPKVQFEIRPQLRVKTFYSTRPFAKLPGQTMITIEAPHRLHEEIIPLKVDRYSANSWRYQLPDGVHPPSQADSTSFSTNHNSGHTPPQNIDLPSWSTDLSFPIQVPGGLHPSFCSALASRQYSLALRIKMMGANVKDFCLEVPLQLVYFLQRDVTPSPGSSSHTAGDGGESLAAGPVDETDIDALVRTLQVLHHTLTCDRPLNLYRAIFGENGICREGAMQYKGSWKGAAGAVLARK